MSAVLVDSAFPKNTISGVVLKELKTHPDDRGFFRELIRHTDPFFSEGFAQWSHSKMAKNTVKAWHYHHLQVDWWYVPFGLVQVALYDAREESPTYRMKMEFYLGESDSSVKTPAPVLSTVIKIPQGVLHGCKVLTESAHLFYITSMTYNPDDEGRYPFDSDIVPHCWGNSDDLIVAANDRKTFVPKAKRVALTLP